MRRSRCVAVWLLSLWLLAACSGEAAPTQLIVEVDTDLKVPRALDRVTLSVEHAKATTASADLTGAPLPRTLGMVHSGGPLGPFVLHATGWLNNQVVVETAVETAFKEGKTVHISLFLERACVDVVCADGETCSDGTCRPVAADADGGVVDVDASDDGGALADAGMSDASQPDAGQPPGAPTCVIEQPLAGDTLQVGTQTNVRGRCTEGAGVAVTQGLVWRSDVDGMLASGANANITLQSAGSHMLSLCAPSQSDRTLIGCATVAISAVVIAPPTAMITSSVQGATTRSPFRDGIPIVFTGVGTGTGISLSWSDSLQGSFGSSALGTLTAPVVGKHTVTLTVTDRSARRATATLTFVVLAQGQSALIDSFTGSSAVLSGVTALAERSPGLAYLGASDGRLYSLSLSSLANPAQVVLDKPPLQGNVQDEVFDSANGLLYLATSSGLTVCTYNGNGAAAPAGCMTFQGGQIPSDNIYAVLRVPAGPGMERLLLGTSAGLFVADNVNGGSAGTVRSDRVVRDMASDRTLVWLATDQGLYRHTVATGATTRVTSGSGSNASWTSLVMTPSGQVWLGGSSGLARYNPSTDAWTFWRANDGLLSTQVNGLAVEQQQVDGMAHDILWIATSAGVSRFDPLLGSFQGLTTADGLPSNNVRKVWVLADGTKLFATDAGLARYAGR